MRSAAIILTVDTPLGDYNLAGQPGAAFLEAAAGQFTDHISLASALGKESGPQLREWLDDGVARVLLLRGDRPLLSAESLSRLLENQSATGASLVVLPESCGALPAGCAEISWLWQRLEGAAPPLTLEDLAQAAGCASIAAADPEDCLAVDTLPSLAEAERITRRRINLRWMQAGVQIVDPATTYVHATVTIDEGTVVLPNTHLWGRTAIGEDCRIGPNSIVRDCTIGKRCTIIASVAEEAIMDDESDAGPFSHLRRGAHLCHGAHMGNFGEIKASTLGPHSKMGHFSYLGDTTVGENVNIGAGTITCNYDGERKHRTVIQDGAFIGSDVMLVAPLEIGAGARIGAGSVVTHDVPAGAVAYGVPARVKRVAEAREEEEESNGPSS